MKQVNLRLIVILFAILVGSGGSLFAVHRIQVRRNAGALLRLARERRESGRSDESIGLFARYLSLIPNDAEARSELARMLYQRTEMSDAGRGTFMQAYQAMESAVRLNPDDVDLQRTLALFLLKTGNFSDARQHFSSLRDRQPSPATSSKSAEAPEADAEDAEDAEIELGYALACNGMGRYDEAAVMASELIGFELSARTFDPAWKPRPGYSGAYGLLAEIFEQRYRDGDTAALIMRRLPEAYPSDAQAWLSVARWNLSHNAVPAAVLEIAKAAELDPSAPDIMFADYRISLQSRNYQRATTILEEKMVAFADDPKVLNGRADLAVAVGDDNKAVEVLTRGVSLHPSNAELVSKLVDIYFRQRRYDEIKPVLENLRTAFGNQSPVVQWAEARLLMAEGKHQQARVQFELLRPLVAQSREMTSNVDLALAMCFLALGQADEVSEAASRVIAWNPNSFQAKVALATADSMAGKKVQALAEFETLAASLPGPRIAEERLLWQPLLELRTFAQIGLPPAERDWRMVDELVDNLAQSPAISASQLAEIRATVLVQKGEKGAAIEMGGELLDSNPNDPQAIATQVSLLLSDRRIAEAQTLIDQASADVRAAPSLLIAATQIAVSGPPKDLPAKLEEIKKSAAELDDRQSKEVLSAILSIVLARGATEDAAQIAEAILKKDPDAVQTRFLLMQIARDRDDVDRLTSLAEEIGDRSGRTTPQACVAQSMVLLQKVSSRRKAQVGDDAVLPPLSAEDESDLEASRNFLIEAENDRPGWAMIQQLFAEVSGVRGDTPTAIDHLQQALLRDSNNPQVARLLAGLLRMSGRLDEARNVIDSLGSAAGDAAVRIAADIDVQAGRFSEAIARAERITPDDSTNADQWVWFGNLLARCGNSERSLEALQRSSSLAPDRLDVWAELIKQQLRMGFRKPAEDSMLAAKAALPSPNRELIVALTYDVIGDRVSAEAAYREAVAAAPRDARIARSLADFLLRQGRIVQAREELLKIIAMPEAAGTQAVYWARRMIAQQASSGVSYRELREVRDLLEKNTDAQGRLTVDDAALEVTLLMDREEPESWRRSVELLEDISSRQPLSIDKRLKLAWLKDKLGNWQEARVALINIAAQPNIPPVVYSVLIEQLLKHQEVAAARPWMAKLRQAAPDAPMTISLEARMAIVSGDREAAVEAMKKLVPADTDLPENAAQLGPVIQLVEELGFPKAADKLLLQFAAASPDGVLARAAFLGRQNRGNEALEMLEQAWDQLPASRILATGAEIISHSGTIPSAEADARLEALCTKARRVDPDSITLLFQEGIIKELVGKPVEAERIYREAIASKRLPPKLLAQVNNNLAGLLATPETAAEAKQFVDAAIEELGPHHATLDTRALVLLAMGNTSGAIEDLRESMLVPSAVKHLHMAAALLEARDLEEAKASLETAMSLGIRKHRMTPSDERMLWRVEKLLTDQPGA